MISKFTVPINCRILKTYVRFSHTRRLSKKSCSTDKPSCEPVEKVGGRIARSRCEENKATRIKCPKKSFDEICCKPLFAEQPPKCKSSISEDYKRGHLTVKLQASTLRKYVEESVHNITNEMEKDLEISRAEVSSRMQNIQRGVEEKVTQLVQLDPFCGSAKKNGVRLISDKARQELRVWQCDSAPGMRKLKSDLSRLSHDMTFKTQTAIALVLCCRNCRSPQSLESCVRQNVQEALRILENASIDAKRKLATIREYKSEIFEENRQAAADVSKAYDIKMGEISKHLSDCIDELKGLK